MSGEGRIQGNGENAAVTMDLEENGNGTVSHEEYDNREHGEEDYEDRKDTRLGRKERLGCLTHISLLSAGQLFRGIQMVKSKDTWNVNVLLQFCDIQAGYLCGTMEAVNVPNEKSSVLTFWEGEIINDVDKFWTKQWSASRKTDMAHWSQFPAFASVKKKIEKDEPVEPEDILGTHVFMRWKERFFVKVGLESRITIAGFYYICFSRVDGSIDGYYYDPLSSPFQRLRLQSSLQGLGGYGFPEYSFH